MLWFLVIWLTWKCWIWLVGVEHDPIETRHFPGLSILWENLNDQLRMVLINSTEWFVQLLGYATYKKGNSLWITGYPGISIGNYCLGMQLMFYHVALMAISPISVSRKILYAVAGVLLIQFLNMLRITGLLLISVYKPSLLILSHDYLFMIPIVALTLYFYYRTSIRK